MSQTWNVGDRAQVYHSNAPVGVDVVVLAAYEDRHDLVVVRIGADPAGRILAVGLSNLRRAAEVSA